MKKTSTRSAPAAMTAIGLMSGTSADGVDAALVTTDGEALIEFHGGTTLPYSDDMRARLLEASQHNVRLEELLRIERELTLHHAAAINQLRDEHPKLYDRAQLIGFHGHTVRHIPGERLTWQIGNPWLLADATGKRVVSDFRRHDMSRGGQGAPLVAIFHSALFAGETLPVVVLNLGGVANITWLGPNGEIVAGDTGPGCGLLDEWVEEMAGLTHDKDGQLAKSGRVHHDMLEEALATDFFAKPLPKSADRFDFDHIDVSGLSIEDGAATLCAVTTEAVARAIARMTAQPETLWVTGGGVHHPVIMEQLRAHFRNVHSIADRGLSPDTLEAECFAWLAVRHHLGLPISIPETTGCIEPTSGGMSTC